MYCSCIVTCEVSGGKSFRLDKCPRLDIPCSLTTVDVVQYSSVAQSCPTLCDPMDCSTSGPPVHHQLPESAQAHVHWVTDAIQQPHPLLPPSFPAFNLSQHQGLFKWVSSLNQMAKDWSFSFSISPSNVYSELISFRIDCFDPLPSKELLRVFSCTTIQKHQFFSSHPSFWSNCHKHTWLLEKP